ncbi:MAG: ankyrin repeat domain-containing protein [Verrucomicrobiales bacterium]|nr:ankyrin repeat domain-containing protein [Verrucomicrobiales bacterium]
MNPLLNAIVKDDRTLVRTLLSADPGLATTLIRSPTLHETGIHHWIYAGDTALHLAAAGYRVDCVRSLLKAGADPNAAGNHRRSGPLHYAADGAPDGPAWDPRKQVATLRSLLDHGAHLHLQDANGATALHRAVRTRCAAAVRFLLEAGGDPERSNHSGSTPFHLAVQNTGRGGSGSEAAVTAQKEIIEAFLARGVSPDLCGGSGKSVRASARSPWILELLS